MKRATLLTVLLASGAILAGTQASAEPPTSFAPTGATSTTAATAADNKVATDTDFLTGEINLDVTGRNDVDSSKFQEYRNVVKGVSMPFFRLFGAQDNLRFDLRGENVKQLDERYTAYLKTDSFAINADYNAIIHNLGFGGRTMLSEQSPGVWRMSPALQLAFQNIFESTPTAQRLFPTFITPLFAPSIAEGNVVDISVQRQRTNIGVDLAKNKPFTLNVSYSREQRHGSGGLSGNNINYIVETPSVTEYLTQDYGFNAALNQAWGNLHGAFHYNTFTDQVDALRFDNPLRASDALAVTVGTGTAAAAVGGATSGLEPTPPDNSAYTGVFGTVLKLPAHTRIIADLTVGNLKQNAQLFPFATSTALITPVVASSTASLPVQSLNGKIATTSFVFGLTTRPVKQLQLSVRYRSYNADNQTARITFANGVAPRDFSWTNGARITAPYSVKTGRFDVNAGVNVGQVTFEGGFRQTKIDRDYRETAQTTENAGTVAAVLHINEALDVRAKYEKANRTYGDLELGRSEDGTFVTPNAGLPANVLERDGNLRYDQANRESNRAGLDFDVSLGSKANLDFSYLHHMDTYKDTVHGLQDDKYDTYTAEFNATPAEQFNLFAYYTYEKNGQNMVSSGNSPFLPVNDFNSLAEDKSNSFGAGTKIPLVPNKAALNLSARYQKVDGNLHFTVDPASTNALGRVAYGGVKDPTNVDDTKITRVDGSIECIVSPKVTLTVGAWYENYSISDYMTSGLPNLEPTAFFIAANNGNYNAKVAFARLTYHW